MQTSKGAHVLSAARDFLWFPNSPTAVGFVAPVVALNIARRVAEACGSGNFLVIAYTQMREIEAELNRRRGKTERASDIPLTR